MKRVLHLVRTTLPPGVLGPEDLVVYIDRASPADPGHALWIPDGSPHVTDRQARVLTSRELCDLIFEHDSVAVW